MRNSLASTLLRLFRERSQGTSLKSLAREGVQKVTVLDAAKLQELVEQAVQDTLLKRGIEIGSGEREAFLAEAAEKVKHLMAERDTYKAQTNVLSEEKSQLSNRLEEVNSQYDQEKKNLEEQIASRERTLEEERESGRKKLQDQARAFEVKMQEVTESLEHERIRLASQIEVLHRDLGQTRTELEQQRTIQTEREARETELRVRAEDLSRAQDDPRNETPSPDSEDRPLTEEEAEFLSDPSFDLPERMRTAIEELLQHRADHREGGENPELAQELESLSEGIVNIGVSILNDMRRHALSQARVAQKERIENLERRITKLRGNLANAESLLATVQDRQADDPGLASVYREIQGLKSSDDRYENKKKLLEEVFNQNLVLKGLIQEGGVE